MIKKYYIGQIVWFVESVNQTPHQARIIAIHTAPTTNIILQGIDTFQGETCRKPAEIYKTKNDIPQSQMYRKEQTGRNLTKDIIAGIKCDNPTCQFRDRQVNSKNAHQWIDKPCPKCGTVLLKQAEYDAAINLQKICDVLTWRG